MDKELLIKNGLDMIYLAACALHSKTPSPEIVGEMDLAAVHKLSKKQSMQAITASAVGSFISAYPELKSTLDTTLVHHWLQERSISVRKAIMMDAERSKVLTQLEEAGIWYLPLKGIVMQEYYPAVGMRQMSDNDILVDPTARQVVRNLMTDLGYQVLSYKKGAHDVYSKGEFYHFEMHASLYNKSARAEWFAYYDAIKSRLLKDESNGFGYHFSNEDFYIYTLTHTYKHFSTAGTGIRPLMDIFVFRNKMDDVLDHEYIKSQLKVLGIFDFEETVRLLSQKLFSENCVNRRFQCETLTAEEKETLFFCLTSNTHGRFDVGIDREIDKTIENGGSKLKYFFRRLFPDMNYYKEKFPLLYKYKVLIPFFLIYRAVHRLIVRPKLLWKELKLVLKHKKH